ncbi:hypothetical protein ACH5RR_027881 [Cinchona calisaya]|uniref:Uncharacterized protein n=1 Tax=Cinchona calisaya TaxID=153742 RepID=A0ABD2YR67_9GENT
MSSTEGRYNLYSQGSTGWSTTFRRNEEFQEDEDVVWGTTILRGRKEFKNSNYSDSYREATSKRLSTTASRMIPKANSNTNSISESKPIQHSSAPVNIPDWSRIYGKNSSNKASSNTAYSWLD